MQRTRGRLGAGGTVAARWRHGGGTVAARWRGGGTVAGWRRSWLVDRPPRAGYRAAHLDMAKKIVSVATLVDQLRATAGAPITSGRILDVLGSVRLDEKSLKRYLDHTDSHYSRHLIHRDDHFDIMALCWMPGQGTPVHTHNGQLGWAFTVRGALDCVEYRWKGCDRPENQDVSGLDCTAGGMQVNLEPLSTLTATPDGPINTVTKRVTIHSLAVPPDCDEPVVSFHVYSLPFDSCVVFDVARGSCHRKPLRFDSAPSGYDVPLRA